MRRELSDESVAHQAEQLVAYAEKIGSSPAQLLATWARTKGLSREDMRAILRAATLLGSDRRIA